MRQRSEGRDRRLLLALYTFSFRSVRTEINALAVVEAAIAACYDGSGRLLACPSVVLTFSVAMMMYDNYSTLCDALSLFSSGLVLSPALRF